MGEEKPAEDYEEEEVMVNMEEKLNKNKKNQYIISILLPKYFYMFYFYMLRML